MSYFSLTMKACFVRRNSCALAPTVSAGRFGRCCRNLKDFMDGVKLVRNREAAKREKAGFPQIAKTKEEREEVRKMSITGQQAGGGGLGDRARGA